MNFKLSPSELTALYDYLTLIVSWSNANRAHALAIAACKEVVIKIAAKHLFPGTHRIKLTDTQALGIYHAHRFMLPADSNDVQNIINSIDRKFV